MSPMTCWRSTQRATLWIAAAVMMPAATAAAATINLNTTYDGMAVSDTLPGYRYAAVAAFNQATRTRTTFEEEIIDGAVSIDLEPGTYNIGTIVAPDPLDGRSAAAPGDLRATIVGVEVPAQGTLELDSNLRYAVHITSPIDNGAPWSGNLLSCPEGPEVSSNFTLAWGPIPNATRYEVQLRRTDCNSVVEVLLVPAAATSLELTIDPEVADTLAFTIRGYSDQGRQLVTNPRMAYDDASGDRLIVHALADGSRPRQSTDSRVALQVARAAGVGTSFWTSDLTISNPTPALTTATLVFTPRGADGSVEYETATIDIPGGATRTIRDVVGSVFGITTAAGSLELRPSTLQAWVRTATPANAGSYGQGYPMVAPDDPHTASLAGSSRTAAGGVVRGEARTNFAVAELWGLETSIRVRLLDREGGRLGSIDITLRPFENRQINDIVQQLAGSSVELTEGRVTVEVVAGGGRIAAALSIVDNDSDDPTTVMLETY